MSDTVPEHVDWSGVSEEMVRHILQQGETYLQSQVDIAISADQRAITAASIFATFGTAFLGGALAYWGVDSPDFAVFLAGLSASLAMGVAAYCGFWAARPIDIYSPGNQPAQYFLCRTADLVGVLGAEAENYQDRIVDAQVFWWGVRVATFTPAIALVVWGATSYLCP